MSARGSQHDRSCWDRDLIRVHAGDRDLISLMGAVMIAGLMLIAGRTEGAIVTWDGGDVNTNTLTTECSEADNVAAVVEGDGEVAKQTHTAEDQRALFMRREDATQTQGVRTNFHRQPSLMHSQPTTFNAEKRILRTPGEIDSKFCFRDGSWDDRTVGAGINEKIKWQIPVTC